MTNTEILRKLIGSITPTGDSGIDKERFENIKETCEVVSNLLRQIQLIGSIYGDSQEHSVKKITDYANEFIKAVYGE